MATLRPRVTTNITENLSLIPAAGAQTIAIIGTAQWGELNVVKSLTTLNDAIAVYGADLSDLTLIKAIDLATRNGASSIKSIRIADGSAAKSTNTFDGNVGAEADVLTFDALYEGVFGDTIAITISANAITPGNRDIVIDNGSSIETFNNGTAGYATNAAIKTAIDGNSALISLITVKAGSEATNLVDATVGKVFLASGDDGKASITDTIVLTAVTGPLNLEAYSILVAPRLDADHASVSLQDAYFEALRAQLQTRAISEQKYAVVFGGVTLDETITEIKTRTSSGSRLALVTPSIKYTASFQTTQLNLNGSYTAAAYAGVVSALSLGQTATHKAVSVSPVINVAADTLFYNKSEQETLLEERMVPITFEADQIIAVRSVTRDADTTSVFYEQSIQLVLDAIQGSLEASLGGFIGDINNERVRTVIANDTDAEMQVFQSDEVIVAFQDTVVTEGTSPDTVNVAVTFQPVFGINFINLNLTVSRVS